MDSFSDLLAAIGRKPDEQLIISYMAPGATMANIRTTVAEAPEHVERLSGAANLWFSVQPHRKLPRKGRVKAADVAAVVTLYCDLDFKQPGGLEPEQAAQVIRDLSNVLGTKPAAMVRSGFGVQPYWRLAEPVDPGMGELLLGAWRKLVTMLAARAGGQADSGVYDLPRILRVPGPPNLKTIYGPGGAETSVSIVGGKPIEYEAAFAAVSTAIEAIEPEMPENWGNGETDPNIELKKVEGSRGVATVERGTGSPMDDFESATEWADLLEPLGWVLHSRSGDSDNWTRPGKSPRDGFSATTNYRNADRDRLHIFSDSEECSPFRQGKKYSKTDAFALINRMDPEDISGVVKKLASSGYGADRNAWAADAPVRPSADRIQEAQEVLENPFANPDVVAEAEKILAEEAEPRFFDVNDLDGIDPPEPLLTGLIDKNSTAFLSGMFGTYKAQPYSSPIATPTGWTTMGQLSVGSVVLGRNGKPCRVTGVHEQGERTVWEVETRQGIVVECAGDHLWTVTQQANVIPWKVLRTIDLVEKQHHNWQLPVTDPVELESIGELPIEPYRLGLLIGDGGMTAGCPVFTTVDAEMLDAVVPDGMVASSCGWPGQSWRIVNAIEHRGGGARNPLTSALRELGLWGKLSLDKFIPAVYMRASIQDRLALLQGLMDTDGTVQRGALIFCTSSRRLAKDFSEMVRSLGGVAKERWRETPHADACHLSFRLPLDMAPFRLSRKIEQLGKRGNYAHPRQTIVRVECTNRKAPMRCITVDSEDSLYLTNQYVPTHNTFIAIAWACSLASGRPWGSHTVPEPRVVVYVAAEGASGLNMRAKAWQKANGPIPEGMLWVFPRRVKVMDDAARDEIWNFVREKGAGMLILDTFHKMTPGVEENSSTEVGDAMAAVDIIREDTGCSVLWVHHTGHVGTRTRGSSSIEDDADASWIIELEDGDDRHRDNRRILKQRKIKDGELAPDRALLFCDETVTVRGKDIRSGWVDMPSDELFRGKRKGGGETEQEKAQRERRIRRDLLDYIVKVGVHGSKSAMEGEVTGGAKAIREALDWLLGTGLIRIEKYVSGNARYVHIGHTELPTLEAKVLRDQLYSADDC